jgi:putative transposase
LTTDRMCTLAGVGRAGFYRYPPDPPAPDSDPELGDAIQRIALEFPSYGWRRVTAELERKGFAVNHKRVYRCMRQDNLLCLRRRKFVVTTDSDHGLTVYPNLARTLILTGVDQLWVADVTYIRLEAEFVYLAVILDAFSRRVVGWALDRSLETELTLEALRMALARRRAAPGLVHHSDRGVQYASRHYTQLLQEHGVQISMSRKANPWDNAACESFIKTLKYEEVVCYECGRSRLGRKQCFIKDEGWPLGVGLQERTSNHHKLRRSRAFVVSVDGKGGAQLRQVRIREANESEPLMRCRNVSKRRQNRNPHFCSASKGWEKPADCPTGVRHDRERRRPESPPGRQIPAPGECT